MQYSTVASPATFINLATVNFNPAVANNLQTANRVTIAEDTLPFLATGVGAIRFNFDPASENGYTGYAEIDVNGQAVPEPGAVGAMLVAASALSLRQRRR